MPTYDADGLGSAVRGDSEKINEEREKVNKASIRVTPFTSSGQVWKPECEMVKKRKNKDFFLNKKSQSWWALRMRFEQTYQAVVEKMPFDIDSIISINPTLEELIPLKMELSQITYSLNEAGKVKINKRPDGTMSPNRADATMIAFNPQSRSLEVWAKLAE